MGFSNLILRCWVLLLLLWGWQVHAQVRTPSESDIARILTIADHRSDSGQNLRALDTILMATRFESSLRADSEVRERLHYSLAQIFQRMKAQHLAAEHFKQCFWIHYLRTREIDLVLLGAVGSVLMQGKFWDESRYYFELSVRHAVLMEDWDRLPTCYNNLGILYLEKGDLDSARHCLQMALQRFADSKSADSLFQGSIRDNLARVEVRSGHFEAALALYQLNVLTYGDLKWRPHGLVQALLGAAAMHQRLGQVALVGPLLERAAQTMPKVNPAHKEPLQSAWIQQELDYQRATGNAAGVLKYAQLQAAFIDSIHQVQRSSIESITMTQAKLWADAMAHEREVEELKLQEKEAKLANARLAARNMRILMVVIVVALLAVGFLTLRALHFRSVYLRRQVELNQAQNKVLTLQMDAERLAKENLALTIELKAQDLTNFALHNKRQRELLRRVGTQLKKLKTDAETRQAIGTILHEMAIQVQDQHTTRLMEDNIDQVNAEFRSRLLGLFPTLTPNEIELCGMIRLNMQLKEIATLKSISENAVQVARKRLRKKMQLDHACNLAMYLQSV